MKVLGTTLDRNLNFRAHFQETRASCESRINVLRSLAGKHIHANRPTRQRISDAIIVSKLVYGIELTSSAPDLSVDLLAPIYNRALRTTSGLLPSTPADTACAEAGRFPFRYLWDLVLCRRAVLHVEKTTSNYIDPLMHLASTKCIEATGQSLPTAVERHWNGSIPWNTTKVNIDRSIQNRFKAGQKSPEIPHVVQEWISTSYPNHTIRFTDGSKASDGVGFGLTENGPNPDLKYKLPPSCSIFSAEAAAIFTAATKDAPRPLLVITDSASVINALTATRSVHPWIQATQLYAPENTTFAWVPSHSGIPGNERADKLAQEGRRARLWTSKVPAKDIKTWLSNTFRNSWEVYWATQNTALHKIKGNTTAWTDTTDHKDQRILSRLRTGHTRLSHNLKGHFFRIMCPVCSVRNTPEHVICQCPQYEDPRRTFGIPASIRDTLQNCPSAEKKLLKFLRAAKLYWEI